MAQESGQITLKAYNGDLPDDLNLKLQSFRCQGCNRHLGYHAVVEGTVVLKCRRCKTTNVIEVHNLVKIQPLDTATPQK